MCLKVLLISVSFYVFVMAVKELKTVLSGIHFSGLFKKDEDLGVEIPVVEAAKPRYDVLAFKRRIEEMKDEDGLYDAPLPASPPTDFTGTEVISENFELELDKLLRSK